MVNVSNSLKYPLRTHVFICIHNSQKFVIRRTMREVYLDYASATPLDPRVWAVMASYWKENFSNPSSLHKPGLKARRALEEARAAIAGLLNARPQEIIFTSGSTEADNLAILGVFKAQEQKIGHLITTQIEHPAILETCEHLEKEGWQVSYLSVNENGLLDSKTVAEAIRPDTLLISIGYANSEIGTIQPISEIGRAVKQIRRRRQSEKNSRPLYFHTDASSAAGFLELDAEKLGVDLMTLSSAKVYGPKGAGALFVRQGVGLGPLHYGGGQEGGLRPGTENVPAIVGFGKALEIAQEERLPESARLTALRDYFTAALLHAFPGAVLNGDPLKRLPNNVNISIPGIEAEAAVLYLDAKGISISTGSACTQISLEPSAVILALGCGEERARSSLRFTLGRKTTKEDLDYALGALLEVVATLRPRSNFEVIGQKKTISHFS